MKNLCAGSDQRPTDPNWKDDRRLLCQECKSLVRVKQNGTLRKHPAPASLSDQRNWYGNRRVGQS